MTWAGFEKNAYRLARDWGIQPSEFWGMSPWEWWLEFDAKIETQRRIEEMKSPARKVGTSADWDRAWKEHRAKIKAKQNG